MRADLSRHAASIFIVVSAFLGAITMSAQPPAVGTAPLALTASVVRSYPHDRSAFTQGLVLRDGVVYESTGLVGRSSLRRVDLETGRVTKQVDVPAPYFAEGLADVGNRLLQLTWQHGRVFVYDKATFGRVAEFQYQGEGWGLCHDGQSLVMSNGSDALTVRHPATFAVTRTVKVTMAGQPVDRLNELECVGGEVYANVWTTDTIVRIDMTSGRVTARIDASRLLAPAERLGVDVLNGIAHDSADGTFLITGKLWPKIFKVRFAR
jgi:glutaminyl-peptide cyclotransferase